MKHSLTDKIDHNLVNIMNRNNQIGEFSIPSATAAGTILYTLDPGTIFNNVLNIANKLTGFLCVFADVEIELRYNVEPQAVGGITLAQFYPQAKSIAEINNLNGNQMLWSAVGTHVNLLTETSSKTTIKYLSTSMTYSANTLGDVSQTGFWPRFQVYMWSPYVSPTNTSLQFTVYARLVNIVPMIPTILMIKPPSAFDSFETFYKVLREKMPYKITNGDVDWIVKQMNDLKPLTAQTSGDQELREEKGTISETIDQVGNFIQKLPPFPLVNEIKEIASIVVPAASGVTRYFGYSKPEDHKIAIGSEQMNSVNMNNIDGAVNAYNLANSAHQRRAVAPLARDKCDELALAHFAKRPAYFKRFTIGRTTGANTVVFKQDISPFRFSAGTSPNQLCTPLSFTSLPFSFWRGDIYLRLRAFANQFINYNLQMGVVYGVSAADITDATDLSNVYNYIYDGKQLSTIDYRIEFKSQNPWKITNSNQATFVTATSEECVGVFVVRLQNAFTSSSSTVDSIDITVEAFGADNLKYNRLQHVPYNFQEPLSEPLIAQTSADATAVSSDEVIGNPTIGVDEASPIEDALTFGQALTSFKQLFNTEQHFTTVQLKNPPTAPAIGDIFMMWPYNCLAPNDGASTFYNYLTLFSQPFAFLSGELIVSFFKFDKGFDMDMDWIKFDPQILPSQISLANSQTAAISSAQSANLNYMQSLGSTVIVQNTLQSRKVVKVPNFLDRPIFLRPTADGVYETGVRNHYYPAGAVVYGNPLNTLNGKDFSTYLQVRLRGADNYHCHFFNGLTMMYFNESLAYKSLPVAIA